MNYKCPNCEWAFTVECKNCKYQIVLEEYIKNKQLYDEKEIQRDNR